MKLFVSTIVVASVAAQDTERNFNDYNLGDFGGNDYGFGAFDGTDSNFAYEGTDYSDLYASYGVDTAFTDAAAAAAVVADEAATDDKQKGERYFNVAATPALVVVDIVADTTSGDQCFKCDEMDYTKCASEGTFETCALGDLDCCFVEVRVSRQGLQQLCTGCKDLRACHDNKQQNLVQNVMGMNQCSPDHIMAKANSRFENHQSVCRTCFNTCNSAGNFCFGGFNTVLDGATDNPTGVPFPINYVDDAAKLDQQTVSGRTNLSGAFGIPTGVFLNANTRWAAANTIVTSEATNLFALNGKAVTASTGDDMVMADQIFWSVEAGDRQWWNDDHMLIQTTYRADMEVACPASLADDNVQSYTTCSATFVPSVSFA